MAKPIEKGPHLGVEAWPAGDREGASISDVAGGSDEG